MTLTTDPKNPKLQRGVDTEPTDQHEVYLILSDEELAKGFVRPYRDAYIHLCGAVTKMGRKLSETYARDPKFYGSTYCSKCHLHAAVSEFKWLDDNEVVGS